MPAAAPAPPSISPAAPAQLFRAFCSALIFTFCAITLIAADIGSALFFVLALLGVVAAFYPASSTPVPREIKLVFFAFGVFFLGTLLAYVINDGSAHSGNRPDLYALFLLAIPLYYLLRRAQPSIGALWWGVCLGASVAGLAAMDQVWWHTGYVADHRAHPVIFGNLSLLLALLSLAGTGYFLRRRPALALVPLVAAAMGITGSFLSGPWSGGVAHSALAPHGMIGLFSLVLMFGVIGKVFYDMARRPGRDARMMGLAGLIVVVCYVDFSLFSEPFDSAAPITFFTFLVAILATLAPALPRESGTQRVRSLSVTVITKNESDRIEACLASVAGWADEIILLDSGSTDGTTEIARRFATHVAVTDWPGFGPQKQRALERASCEWVLSIDADERVTPELRAEIDALLAGEPASVGYRIPWQVMSHGKVLDFGRSGRAPLRLFRRDGARFTDAQVHEHVVLPARTIGRLQARLIHDSHRSLRHALEKFTHYAWLWAQQRHAKGRRSSVPGAFLHALWMFIGIYFFRLGMLDGRRGFLMAVLFAQYTFNKHAALWTLGLHAKNKSTQEAPP